MKKCLLIILAVCILFSAAGCTEDKKDPASISIRDENGDEFDYPEADSENFTESGNESGMRFTLTLHNYTDAFNSVYYELGGDGDKFSYTKWKKLKKEDKKYEYFYLKSGKITLTATVETESLCLVNVGCGIDGKSYEKNKKNKELVLRISSVCAAASGGYESEDIEFFTALFKEVEKQKEHTLWYNNAVYIYEKTKKGSDETVLFRVLPTSGEKRDEWDIARV